MERDHGDGRRQTASPRHESLRGDHPARRLRSGQCGDGEHTPPGHYHWLPGVSVDAAAIVAAHGVLRHYFPDRAAVLDAARTRSLGRIPDGPLKVGGITIGEAAAARTIAARANDGSEPPESYLPSSSNSGEWQLTSDCPATGGVFLHWRNVTPFALRRADQFRSDPPPALTGSRYTRDYKEVKEVGPPGFDAAAVRRGARRPVSSEIIVVLSWFEELRAKLAQP